MSDEVQPGHVRLRLDLSYDGTDFHGWAKQAGGRRTVQGEIEDALRTVTRSGDVSYELTVAGRTDAGVRRVLTGSPAPGRRPGAGIAVTA